MDFCYTLRCFNPLISLWNYISVELLIFYAMVQSMLCKHPIAANLKIQILRLFIIVWSICMQHLKYVCSIVKTIWFPSCVPTHQRRILFVKISSVGLKKLQMDKISVRSLCTGMSERNQMVFDIRFFVRQEGLES